MNISSKITYIAFLYTMVNTKIIFYYKPEALISKNYATFPVEIKK